MGAKPRKPTGEYSAFAVPQQPNGTDVAKLYLGGTAVTLKVLGRVAPSATDGGRRAGASGPSSTIQAGDHLDHSDRDRA